MNLASELTRLKREAPAGFTFVEIMVTLSILGLIAGSSIWALTQINHYASVTRLKTGAETVAQNRIDEILSESPFNPQLGEIPVVLALTPSGPRRSCAHTQTQHGAGCIQIYNEPNPAGGSPRIIYGTLETTVAEVEPLRVKTVPTDLNVFRATVVVRYAFRGKSYAVQFNALRSADL